MFTSQQLKSLRTESGYTQAALAQKIGTTRKIIALLEDESISDHKYKKDMRLLRNWWAACHSQASERTRSSLIKSLKSAFSFTGLF